MLRRWLASASLVLFVALALPTAGNHPQQTHGDVLVFDHKSGNEWWVEVVLSGGASGSVQSVQAMDNAGPWVTLTKRSWGAWAASFQIEPGHQVRFRALWAGGDSAESCWFDHPSGVERCSAPPPPSGDFDATFSDVKGNNWWAEAVITATGPVHAVLLTINCQGEPGDMTFRPEWNKWTLGNTHIPTGAKVTMTAIGDGGSDESGGYIWPQATPTSGCGAPPPPPPPQGFATFSNVKGNEWWVEVKVTSSKSLAGVDARLGCSEGAGSWMPLTKRSWGAWAGSFRVFPGTHVDFRARATDGATTVSDAYIWPEATKTDRCDAPWPRESSFAQVRFRGEDRWSDVDGNHLVKTDGLVSVQFRDGAWDGTCEVRREHRDGAGRWTNVTETWPWDQAPPRGERNTAVGAEAQVEAVENCAQVIYTGQDVVGRERRTFSIRTSSGDPVPIEAYHSQETGPTIDYRFWWDTTHGLVLSWDNDVVGGSNTSHMEGWLQNTDARVP